MVTEGGANFSLMALSLHYFKVRNDSRKGAGFEN